MPWIGPLHVLELLERCVDGASGFFESDTGPTRRWLLLALMVPSSWLTGVACTRCAEIEVYKRRHSLLNKKRPRVYPEHIQTEAKSHE